MKRRTILGLISLAPITFAAAKIPVTNRTLIINLIKRWKKSKAYTLQVFDAMPEDQLEYAPSPHLLSFVQHFLHIGFTNNKFIGVLVDSKTYPDFDAVMKKSKFLIERPDPINLFQPDTLQKRDAKKNKTIVRQYLSDTFDYVIESLENLSDEDLVKGLDKEKPWYLEGHSHLDLILRGESHTSHHRAQAITYLRLSNNVPPGYSKNNTL